MKALVILSGGQDSTTCMFELYRGNQLITDEDGLQRPFIPQQDEIHAITFDYGQRHDREILCAEKVARMANVTSHEIIQVPDKMLKSISPLVSNSKLETYSSFDEMTEKVGNNIEKTFVPMRNMLFLTIATNHALAIGATAIYIGICAADTANYPDCTGEFFYGFGCAAYQALGKQGEKLVYRAPLLNLSKKDTVQHAFINPNKKAWEALAYTQTGYDGAYPPVDKNHSNILRAQGFLEANLPDPLIVRAWCEGVIDFLPSTENYEKVFMCAQDHQGRAAYSFETLLDMDAIQ